MKKIDVGQTVQILTNVGVIVGIVLLGIELRQNNAALGVQTRLEREDVRSFDWMFTYMQVQDGLLDEDAIPLGQWREAFRLPYRRMAESWVGTEHRYTPEFVRFMNEQIVDEAPRK